nr:ketopantoate reductase C-terminal domain-containing protein [Candidatus Solincola tengchongensis]
MRSAAPVSALCALGGAGPSALRGRRDVGEWLGEAVAEATRVAASLGLELPDLEDLWEDAVWDRLPPPMLRDVMAGGATERDHTTGFLVREASRCGIRVPLLSALHSLLAEVERGERTPGEPLLRELRRRFSEERGMSLM